MEESNSWFLVGDSEEEIVLRSLRSKAFPVVTSDIISLFEFKEIVDNFLIDFLNENEKSGYADFVDLLTNPEKALSNNGNLEVFCCVISHLLPPEVHQNLDSCIINALNCNRNKTPRKIEATEEPKYKAKKFSVAFEFYYPLVQRYIKGCCGAFYRMYKRALVGSGVSLEDLEQEAVFGLNQALISYDEERDLLKFARWCITKWISSVCQRTLTGKRSGKRTIHCSEFVHADGEKSNNIEFPSPDKRFKNNIPDYDKKIKNFSTVIHQMTEKERSSLRKVAYNQRPHWVLNYEEARIVDNSLRRIKKAYWDLVEDKQQTGGRGRDRTCDFDLVRIAL